MVSANSTPPDGGIGADVSTKATTVCGGIGKIESCTILVSRALRGVSTTGEVRETTISSALSEDEDESTDREGAWTSKLSGSLGQTAVE